MFPVLTLTTYLTYPFTSIAPFLRGPLSKEMLTPKNHPFSLVEMCHFARGITPPPYELNWLVEKLVGQHCSWGCDFSWEKRLIRALSPGSSPTGSIWPSSSARFCALPQPNTSAPCSAGSSEKGSKPGEEGIKFSLKD